MKYNILNCYYNLCIILIYQYLSRYFKRQCIILWIIFLLGDYYSMLCDKISDKNDVYCQGINWGLYDKNKLNMLIILIV